MLDFNTIIENAFNEKFEILKEIKFGLTCQTYLVNVKNNKYIFQIYTDKRLYQAKKKYNILNKIDSKFIPKAIKVEENEEYSYLITEYFEGKSLHYYRRTNLEFSLKNISNDLASVLGQIHNISDIDKFGWINDNYVNTQNSLVDYIKYEYNRLSINFEKLDEEIKHSILKKVKKAIEIIERKSEYIAKPVLCWYDTNPGNILINQKNGVYNLSALIDPGGARYGVPEWDIAFMKMQVCRSKDEFDDFFDKYIKLNSQIHIDIELVNALSIIVEFDVMSIELAEDALILPIPYDTNFRDEIEFIHEMII